MSLFDVAKPPFRAGDVIELRRGVDLNDPYSKCRVIMVDCGAVAVVPWLVRGKLDERDLTRWVRVDTADKLYRKTTLE
jgi:hypothetical protein